MLQEQTTKAWESLEWPDPQGAWKFTSENLDEGEEVAGRYGSWTNVFIIGRTVCYMISLDFFPPYSLFP